MPRRASLVVVVALLAGCNILSGASTLDFAASEEPTLPDREEASPPSVDAPADEPLVVVDAARDADAAVDAAVDAVADADAGPPVLRVFLSSSERDGRFGGFAAADVVCNNLAGLAGYGGTWVAWLSTKGGADAFDRLTSAGPWYLVTGELVATTKAQLVSGVLIHAIDRDEKRVAHPALTNAAWTGTGIDGRAGNNDCNGWTTGAQGGVGDCDFSDTRWTFDRNDNCSLLNRFYCFQL